MEAYCFTCKQNVEMQNLNTYLANNGCWMAKGNCVCGRKLSKILGKKWQPTNG